MRTCCVRRSRGVLAAPPDLGWSKGSAIRRIFEETAGGPETGLLYAGDEANDGDAFEATVSLGGIALGIGEHAPGSARFRLPDPEALTELLRGFLDRLGS